MSLKHYRLTQLALMVALGVYLESWLWGLVAFAVTTLKDCFVVTAMISTSRANAISAARARNQQEQRNRFGEYEGRLLDRGEMSVAPASTRPFDSTGLPSPEEYGR